MNDESLEALVTRLENLPSAEVGRGPLHPIAPNTALADRLADVLHELPFLHRYEDYVNFLQLYGAGGIFPDFRFEPFLGIYGIVPSITESILEPGVPVVDDDGYFVFAHSFSYVSTGFIYYAFSFDTHQDRSIGVYSKVRIDKRRPFGPYRRYCTSFREWLRDAVDNLGDFSRCIE